MIEPGRRNRRVRIERMVASTGFSTGTETWELFKTVWAEVQDNRLSRSERDGQAIDIATRRARVTIDYRQGITSGMRVVMGDRVMQIVSPPVELGHREGLEFTVEDYSVSGGAA